MNERGRHDAPAWLWAGVVFVAVLAADWGLVAVAGTDVPFHDAWNVHGQWLLPASVDGSLGVGDLWRAHSEHRIVWTHALELLLFRVNGQWDPLVEMTVCGVLRAAVAAGLFAAMAAGASRGRRIVSALVCVLAFVPLAGWHNALWGFQTSVFLVLGFGLLALWEGTRPESDLRGGILGAAAGLAAGMAMGPGLLVPAALIPVLLLRRRETGRWPWPACVAVAVLLVGAAMLSAPAAADVGALGARSPGEFWRAAGRAFGWPHTSQPWAALLLNLPAVAAIGLRVARRRSAAPGDDFVTAVALWAGGIALAAAWRRGGSAEWAYGVPSRYADLLVLLPLANLWFAAALVAGTTTARRGAARWLAGAWSAFVLIGWLGLSAEMARRVIIPRARDRDAPVRLILAYQRTADPQVFVEQPRLLVPHPDPAVVLAVLRDPRLAARLPPSLQPERPQGPLSRFVRRLRPAR